MARSNNQVSIIFRAVDQISGKVGAIEKRIQRLDETFGSFGGRIKAGIQWHVVYRGINQITRAVDGLITAIPDLIGKAQEWMATVDRLGDITGMTAEQSSELAAIAKTLGVQSDGLARALTFLSKSAVRNKDAFDEMGVKTRGANGTLLDSYTIFQNLRERISEVGPSLLSSDRAQKVFGRGSLELIDILLLTNKQYQLLANNAARSGLILTEAALKAGEDWERTRAMLDGSLTGLGATILNKVAPVLIRLTNGITQAINANMNKIATFAAQVVAFLAGVIGGFLGIDFNINALAEDVSNFGKAAEKGGKGATHLGKGTKDAASGEDALTRALNRQIDALDRQLAALDRREKKRDARREQADLIKDVQQARAELEELRTKSIFAAGMTNAEEELARQAAAADIIDGEKKLDDARKRLQEARHRWSVEKERDALQRKRDMLQQQLSDHTKALSGMIAANTLATSQMAGQWRKPESAIGKLGTKVAALSKSMEDAIKDALAFGKAFSQDIMTFLFGPAKSYEVSAGVTMQVRTGGLMQGLADLNKTIADIAPVWELVADNLGAFVAGLVALKVIGPINLIKSLIKAPGQVVNRGGASGGRSGGNGDGTGSSRPGGGGGSRGSQGGRGRGNTGQPSGRLRGRTSTGGSGGLRGLTELGPNGQNAGGFRGLLLSMFGMQPDEIGAGDPRLRGIPTSPTRSGNPIQNFIEMLTGGGGGGQGSSMQPMLSMLMSGGMWPGKGNASRSGHASPAKDGSVGGVGDFDPASPGFGMMQGVLSPLLRRYLGGGSPQLMSLAELTDYASWQASTSQATADQTVPLGDGALGVVNPNFGGIGSIQSWRAGELGVEGKGGKFLVDNVPGSYMGIWPTGGKKLPVTGKVDSGEPGVVRDQLTVLKSIAKWTQSSAARLNSGQSAAYWLQQINLKLARGAGPSGQGIAANGRSRGQPQQVTIKLNAAETARFLRGEAVTTSLRPVPGN